MFKCPPPSPNPHFKTGNYFYPLPLCPGALPFHPGNMDQAFNPFFPAYYLLALGPFPLPPLLRPAQTRQNRKCCHEEQEGCPHLWPLLRCQHRTPEPLSLAVPREGRCPEVLGRCTLNVQWCSLACLVPKGKRGPAQGGLHWEAQVLSSSRDKTHSCEKSIYPRMGFSKEGSVNGKGTFWGSRRVLYVSGGTSVCGEVHWSVLLRCRPSLCVHVSK